MYRGISVFPFIIFYRAAAAERLRFRCHFICTVIIFRSTTFFLYLEFARQIWPGLDVYATIVMAHAVSYRALAKPMDAKISAPARTRTELLLVYVIITMTRLQPAVNLEHD
jgi:hypothetical protein